MGLHDISLTTLDGRETTLGEHAGNVLLAVNVASKCGYTKQYAGLEKLHEELADRGFRVLGFPCNQFLFQERGSAEEIAQFCSATYGVTFPMYAKLSVKGRHQHPLYAELTQAPDDTGKAGNVKWNFEKFLISREGQVLGRFRSKVTPEELAPLVERALD